MIHGSTASRFSHLILGQFIELIVQEVGAEKLALILALVNLPDSQLEQPSVEKMDSLQAAEIYASLQQALRMYFGRGARGPLLRIGRRLWQDSIEQASLLEKAKLGVVRFLPVSSRRKRVLEVVAGWLLLEKESISVHLMDVDLLLVDRGSAASRNQNDDEPICYVTLGLIQGALFWATEHEANVEEKACRAMGAPACEFKIKIGERS